MLETHTSHYKKLQTPRCEREPLQAVCVNTNKFILTLRLWSQAESSDYRTRLAEQSERLQRAEKQSEERGQRVEELQRLLGGLETENSALREKMAAGEAELLQLRENMEEAEEATGR